MMQIKIVYNNIFVLHAQRLFQREKTFFFRTFVVINR